jgi:hypothetical protein
VVAAAFVTRGPGLTVPSLSICTGGPPPSRSSAATCRPAAQVPPSRIRASGSSSAVMPSSCRTSGASSSISATVSARHSITHGSCGFSFCCSTCASRGTMTPLSSSRPPLRYSGSAVNASRSVTCTPPHSNGSISE